jgi:hypothetical protein
MTIRAGGLVDVADFADTGWQAVTATSGYTSDLLARFHHGRAELNGTIAPTTDWGSANAQNVAVNPGGVPSFARPTTNNLYIAISSDTNAGVQFRVTIHANGQISVRCNSASHTGAANINYVYSTD